ncbi:MAG: hypothetical protein LPK88_03830 [Alphaproteobacteria bacterium]|nr:hypothetical protein [Alphaproteobacteria bacterium]MDX5415435.1 hypothetical protein [Alphaproteobacteria bacterium]MDX5492663.1 hypothetical protein [Alphaproteobacteria bacterium]
MTKRVLLAGGYGVVGAQVARLLRKHHPDVEILIGGRREREAARLASELGKAFPAIIDVTKPAPLRDIDGIDAVAVFIHEYEDHLLDEAARRGIAYMDITRGLDAQLRGLAAAALHAPASPMLFTSHWMAGGPAIVARRLAHDLDNVDRADMSILYYTGDKMGPDSASAGAGMSQGFTARVDGEWRKVGPLSDERKMRFPSGAARLVYRMNMGDVVTLALANHAREAGVRLGLDKGNSFGSMRRLIRLGLWDLLMKLPGMNAIAATKPGPGAAHEIVIEVVGSKAGRTINRRATILDPQGQSHLTATGALYGLERVAGLGTPPLGPGAALPETGFTLAGFDRLAALYEAEGIELGLQGT